MAIAVLNLTKMIKLASSTFILMVLVDNGLSIIVKHGIINTRVTNKECSVSLGCVGFPKGCSDDDTCHVFATYQVKKNQDVTFTLRGKVSPNKYLALGFSEDNRMGDDLVVYCHNIERGKPVGMSWNTFKKKFRCTRQFGS